MAEVQCPIESIGSPAVGDTVEMKVDSIKDGVATLSYSEAEDADETDDNMKPKPSAMQEMASAFKEEED